MENPPFLITQVILNLNAQIHERLGELKAAFLLKPSVRLRKENRIKTIQHSLAIEGNILTSAQISTLLDKKNVIGPKDQILEVKNALQLYESADQFDSYKESDLLKAHKILMTGLIEKPGLYRSGAVGILKNGLVSKIAPPAKQVPILMKNLFSFLKMKTTSFNSVPLILKACIFHYELEFIHPFTDGNGRMGRLWQQLILMKQSPIFEYIAVESLVHKNQNDYYKSLEQSDFDGNSTAFIEFSLKMIVQALDEFSESYKPQKPKAKDRIQIAQQHFGSLFFSRSEYIKLFKNISSATASRDLAQAVKNDLLTMTGLQAMAKYKFNKSE